MTIRLTIHDATAHAHTHACMHTHTHTHTHTHNTLPQYQVEVTTV